MRARLATAVFDSASALVWTLMLGSAAKRHRCPCGCTPTPAWLRTLRIQRAARP